ncbi:MULTISPECIES: hypothetical protein [unclassified Streptomyces]|uniref:hypothetical protein n=1 Tax=unclassified Streptomyces TaxID=2593676 RepID=UPI003814BDAB
MHKLHKAAVVAVALGSLGFLGAGSAYAGDGPRHYGIGQSASCKSHDLNVDVLGEVGVLNGVLGNALNGEGSPGAQDTKPIGSSMGCSNSAFSK